MSDVGALLNSTMTSAVASLRQAFVTQAAGFVPYSVMFDNVQDVASEPTVAPGAPQTWGTVRLAAWSWAGMDDIGPVNIPAAVHAYGAAQAALPINYRNILSI